MGERGAKVGNPANCKGWSSQFENELHHFQDETPFMAISGHGKDWDRRLSLWFCMQIKSVTLVFWNGDAWPRRCSERITAIIAKEELCLSGRSERCWQ